MMLMLLRIRLPLSLLLVVASTATAFVLVKPNDAACRPITRLQEAIDSGKSELQDANHSRRAFLAASGFAGMALISSSPESAEAIGPIKIDLENPKYSAKPCPKVRNHALSVACMLADSLTVSHVHTFCASILIISGQTNSRRKGNAGYARALRHCG
jgi:hypothetical protein